MPRSTDSLFHIKNNCLLPSYLFQNNPPNVQNSPDGVKPKSFVPILNSLNPAYIWRSREQPTFLLARGKKELIEFCHIPGRLFIAAGLASSLPKKWATKNGFVSPFWFVYQQLVDS